jgi:fumarate reductase flavoprotein subunit
MMHGPAGPLLSSAFLQVNLLGERFQNEDVPIQSNVNALERQPGKTAWQVFDSKYPEEIPHHGIGLGKILVATDKLRQDVSKIAITADSIEELAIKMKLPVDTFKATIKRYNELARMGKDRDFGKRPERLSPVNKPPYYAGRAGYSLLAVMGGLNINQNLNPWIKSERYSRTLSRGEYHGQPLLRRLSDHVPRLKPRNGHPLWPDCGAQCSQSFLVDRRII